MFDCIPTAPLFTCPEGEKPEQAYNLGGGFCFLLSVRVPVPNQVPVCPPHKKK